MVYNDWPQAKRRLSFSTEMWTENENRIEVSDKKDVLAIPRPKFTFDIGAYPEGGLRKGFKTAKELFSPMGATLRPKAKPLDNQQTGRVNWNTAAAHIMGTTIRGDDPRDSVADRWGRIHDIPNLWIVGSSVFSTKATANPTLPIAALTFRTATAIHRQMQAGA